MNDTRMPRKFLFVAMLAFSPFASWVAGAATTPLACQVQAGGCDVVLSKNASGDVVLKEPLTNLGRYAGKTLCLPAGQYRSLYSENLQGRADAIVKVSNCGAGAATFTTQSGSSMAFYNARYVRLTGSGDAATPYGIVAHNKDPQGRGFMVEFGYGSSDIEVDHVEAKGDPLSYDAYGKPVLTGGTGIAIKTYPRCNTGEWRRGTFTQYNTSVHDNYVHDTATEGLYIGTSHNGWVTANAYKPGFFCTGRAEPWIEADLVNVNVAKNRVENTGNDAIQVGGALGETYVRDNVIRGYGMFGRPQADSHASGVQIGAGTRARVERNWIENPSTATWISQGVKHMGLGDSYIVNNVIRGGSVGLMLLRNTDVNHELNSPNTYIYQNTVVGTKKEAIYMLCSYLKTVLLKNNLFAGYGSPYLSGNGGLACVPGLTDNNLFLATEAEALFVDAGNADYHLRSGSIASAGGVNLSGIVDTDFEGLPRQGEYSFGAYRYQERFQPVAINFTTTAGPFANAEWNNFSAGVPVVGTQLSGLRDREGRLTPYKIEVTQAMLGARGQYNDGGQVTGNDSGFYPDAVIGGVWYVGSGEAKLLLSNLDAGKHYRLRVMPSRSGTGTRVTTFTVGGESQSLEATGNTMNTLVFENVVADSDRTVRVGIKAGAGSSYGYINAMEISESTAPASR